MCCFPGKTKEIILIKLPKLSSVFTAESVAILRALEMSLRILEDNHFIIITDCLSILKAIRNPQKHIYKNKILCLILTQLFELSNIGKKITFIWVKGHSNIRGNEIVDVEAKKATTSGSLEYFTQYSDIFAELKRLCNQKWQEQWSLIVSRNASHLARIQPKIPVKPLIFEIDIPRFVFKTIARLFLGHGHFRKHLYRMNLAPNPYCDCDQQSEADLNHIILSCVNNNKHRTELFKEADRVGIRRPWNIEILLTYSLNNYDLLWTLITYISKNRLQNVI